MTGSVWVTAAASVRSPQRFIPLYFIHSWYMAGAAPAESPTVSHGQLLFVHEIVARGAAANNLSVRVTGVLSGIDRALCRAALLDPRISGCQLAVDTSQLIGQNLRNDELVQLIGEIAASAGVTVQLLRARTLRNVDGLDLDVFEKAVKAKRAFEQELAL
jgi:hypothetical protein